MKKRALILGVNGQDGSYLADILLEQGYEVHGLHRHSSCDNLWRIKHLEGKIALHRGDLLDRVSIDRAILASKPDEIYNEADQDNIDWSFKQPCATMDVTGTAVVNLLESARELCPEARVFIPVSATIFGNAPSPQTESTPLNPLSPYAVAKAAAYHAARFYRQVHGMFVATAILYNHDSPRRGKGSLLHELVDKALAVSRSQSRVIYVGDPNAVVDIGYAREYMEAAVKILQQGKPDDFVLSSSHPFTIGSLAYTALAYLGFHSEDMVSVDPNYGRPGLPNTCPSQRITLVGNSGKAHQAFYFHPWMYADELLKSFLSGALKCK